jgi:molybdenum cofactor biosynthesis enzyme MoaA
MSNDDDPLKSLEMDRAEYNRERLAKVLNGIVAIDQESGDPIKLDHFKDLDSRRQLTAILLAKRAAHELGHILEEEVGMNSSELDNHVDVASSTIRLYAREKLSFVENDSDFEGYYIPQHQITKAIEFIEAAKEW